MTPTYAGPHLAILTDLRNPYLCLGDHVEWHRQFRVCINSPKVHKILEQKLAQFAPLVLVYSKIWPEPGVIEQLSGYTNPSVCIISSVGENPITPWMVVHNLAHSYLSWHTSLRYEVLDLLGLDRVHYRVAPLQAHLVKCAASRKGLIPNLAETMYELFTTWVWHGHTQSGEERLAEFCDREFAEVVKNSRGKTVWHRYRPPTIASTENVTALSELLF